MWKLLKYEFRRTRTSLLAVLGVIAAAEVYYLISRAQNNEQHTVISALVMLLASFVAMIYMMSRGVTSYSTELKSKSAYLIFMTPNSGAKIMASKYLYTFVNALLLGAVCGGLGALDVRLLMESQEDWQYFLEQGLRILRLQGYLTGQIILAIVFYLLMVVLLLLMFFAIAYLAITLSHTFFHNMKGRGFIALILFIAVCYGLMKLQELFHNPVDMLVTNTTSGAAAELAIAGFSDLLPLMVPYAVFDLAVILLSLFGCGWMLDKKVSL